MSSTPLPISPRLDRVVVPSAFGAAIAVGLLAAWDPWIALAVCVGAIAFLGAVLMPRLVVYLLLITVFASSFTVGGVTANRLMAPLAAIAVLGQVLREPLRLRPSRVTMGLIAGYGLLAFASLAWSVSPSATLNALGALGVSLAYMGGFMLLVREREDVRTLFWVAAVCSMALGIWWTASYALGVSRYANITGDANFIAALQVVALPIVLALASHARSWAMRAALYAGVAVIAASIVATLSRGELIALLVAVILIVASPAQLLFGSRRRKATLLLSLAAGLLMVLAIAWGDLSARFGQGLSEPGLAAGRGDLAAAAIHGFADHPILGLGYGGFKPSSFQLLRTTPNVQLPVHLRCLAPHATEYLRSAGTFCTGQPVHNAYIESLVELGIPGLFLFMGILAAATWSLVATARRASAAGEGFIASASMALVVGLAALAVASFELSTETSRAPWMIIGLSLAFPGLLRKSGHPSDVPARPSEGSAPSSGQPGAGRSAKAHLADSGRPDV